MPPKKDELLPVKKIKYPGGLHRMKVGDEVFDALEDIRRKNHLWDREAAIIWLLKECDMWEEE